MSDNRGNGNDTESQNGRPVNNKRRQQSIYCGNCRPLVEDDTQSMQCGACVTWFNL